MQTIMIYNGLCNQQFTEFKDYYSVNFYIEAQQAIDTARQELTPRDSYFYDLELKEGQRIEMECKQKASEYEKAYNMCQQFKRAHHDVIYKYELLRDDANYGLGLLDVLLGRTHQDVIAAYKRNHEDILNKYYNLNYRVYQLDMYSPDRLKETIIHKKSQIQDQIQDKKCEAYKQAQQEINKRIMWHKKTIEQTYGYKYFVKNLKIEIEGAVCKMSGEISEITQRPFFTRFQRTFINHKIAIVR